MNNPIFLIGCPRSGTTLTLQILACHEQLAWVSNFLDMNPQDLNLARKNRFYDLPIIGEQLYRSKTLNSNVPNVLRHFLKQLPHPVEPWSFWNYYLGKFQWKRNSSDIPRRTTTDDMTYSEALTLKSAISTICKLEKKDHFLSKYTDFPRISYLTKAYPNAKFIHIIRDGCAVAASYYEKMQNKQFGTWDERDWWMKGWPKNYKEEWLYSYNTPLTFAAFQWKFFVNEIREDAKILKVNQFLEVSYNDIVMNKAETFSKVVDFCGLDSSPKVKRYLNEIDLINNDNKWKLKFTKSEKEQLASITSSIQF